MSVTMNINTLLKETSIVSKRLRQEILGSMDDYMDEVRRVALAKYIIPDKHPGVKLSLKYKKQPSDPVRLTSRTGALRKMLQTGTGQWKKGSSIHRSVSPAIQVENKTLNKNTTIESYEGKMSYNIKNPSSISSKRTAQELRMRFRHETGIRGKKRPFLKAAAERDVTLYKIETLAKNRLSKIGVL